ncbi:lipase, putative [Entamoeba histolytica HM-1:IMSS-B]|uniref:sn-1-specific diacylglycerol lipase n=6 Tax=Entamoeba histolytica TaxID=5759 RepID=C4LZ51_ENTH1|nr:lipase, putative [Entamoeba histolytica HM-1:IMSS]EMD47285.1 lipase, putative [Entamoeba histolytica KU27]EMH72470.1 lipase, putative [Entamoeba histolytica HM-1:IMSS-B]EMS16410.1 lipase domain containing protein [Entamoeba histolytica HM-3:IMSS]ENY65523.1 lipase containing protein, putative [Entamoeba histolytica HM-1:IMSS-A]GAT94124.1 lipase putative [Entamoeba histolytica]|eukprot:XP_655016.1 lipase, putative [Entamoeba histolytica HM-1:IMSS]
MEENKEPSILSVILDAFSTTLTTISNPSWKDIFDIQINKKTLSSLSDVIHYFKSFSELSFIDLMTGYLILSQISESNYDSFQKYQLISKSSVDIHSIQTIYKAISHSVSVFQWTLYESYASNEEKRYYQNNKEEVSRLIISQYNHIHPDDIILLQHNSKPFCPAHYVCVDHSIDAIIVCCRGTQTITDCLVDCSFYYESIYCEGEYGLIHKGIYQTASTIYISVLPAVRKLLTKYPKYKVLCTGHSLGGAVAEIVTLLYRSRNKMVPVYCVAFGAVPAVSSNIAELPIFKECILNIINQNDIVPRASHRAMQELLERIDNIINIVGYDLYYELEDSLGKNVDLTVARVIKEKEITWDKIKNTNYVGQALLPMGNCIEISEGRWFEFDNEAFGQIEPKQTAVSDHSSYKYEKSVLQKYEEITGIKLVPNRKEEYKILSSKFDL